MISIRTLRQALPNSIQSTALHPRTAVSPIITRPVHARPSLGVSCGVSAPSPLSGPSGKPAWELWATRTCLSRSVPPRLCFLSWGSAKVAERNAGFAGAAHGFSASQSSARGSGLDLATPAAALERRGGWSPATSVAACPSPKDLGQHFATRHGPPRAVPPVRVHAAAPPAAQGERAARPALSKRARQSGREPRAPRRGQAGLHGGAHLGHRLPRAAPGRRAQQLRDGQAAQEAGGAGAALAEGILDRDTFGDVYRQHPAKLVSLVEDLDLFITERTVKQATPVEAAEPKDGGNPLYTVHIDEDKLLARVIEFLGNHVESDADRQRLADRYPVLEQAFKSGKASEKELRGLLDVHREVLYDLALEADVSLKGLFRPEAELVDTESDLSSLARRTSERSRRTQDVDDVVPDSTFPAPVRHKGLTSKSDFSSASESKALPMVGRAWPKSSKGPDTKGGDGFGAEDGTPKKSGKKLRILRSWQSEHGMSFRLSGSASKNRQQRKDCTIS
eukprot:scaffold2136_cov242-Pinguiococcus_pyrenoidosus.AAC.21